MSTMLISQLAERAGVRASTLRFYETVGLIQADRTPSGYRVYGDDAVERLAFINTAKQLGLPLEEIVELLQLREAGACTDVRADLRSRLHTRIEQARQHRTDLGNFITTLGRAVDHLDRLPDRPGPCDPECDFLTTSRQAAPVDLELLPRAPADSQHPSPPPPACSLEPGDLGERAQRWGEALAGADRALLPGGTRLTVPLERLTAIAELARAEQTCCPFLDFRLHLDGSMLHLEVRAPDDGASTLNHLFAQAI